MSILEYLFDDIIIYIVDFLAVHDKIKFLSLSQNLHSLKDKIYYKDEIDIKKIHQLWYFDKFTNIIVDNFAYILPKSINRLKLNCPFNINIKGKLPNSITHLVLTGWLDQDIKDMIPNFGTTNLTHLTFGPLFNKSIKGCLPNSITHLYFHPLSLFNQNIKDCIPNSVTHITFGKCFNQDIKGCI